MLEVASSRDRAYQELAWEALHTYETWFRRQYNLPPTDPRYLQATPEQIRVEFWAHVLAARFERARRDGRTVERLEDLLTTPEEAFEAGLKDLDERLAAEAVPVPAETVIAFRAEERSG